MAQFDVYKNLSRDPAIAFLVQIQNDRFDRTLGRVVVALRHRGVNPPPDHAATPHFVVLGLPVFADALDIVTLPARRFAAAVAKLEDSDQTRIITAIDELISRA